MKPTICPDHFACMPFFNSMSCIWLTFGNVLNASKKVNGKHYESVNRPLCRLNFLSDVFLFVALCCTLRSDLSQASTESLHVNSVTKLLSPSQTALRAHCISPIHPLGTEPLEILEHLEPPRPRAPIPVHYICHRFQGRKSQKPQIHGAWCHVHRLGRTLQNQSHVRPSSGHRRGRLRQHLIQLTPLCCKVFQKDSILFQKKTFALSDEERCAEQSHFLFSMLSASLLLEIDFSKDQDECLEPLLWSFFCLWSFVLRLCRMGMGCGAWVVNFQKL